MVWERPELWLVTATASVPSISGASTQMTPFSGAYTLTDPAGALGGGTVSRVVKLAEAGRQECPAKSRIWPARTLTDTTVLGGSSTTGSNTTCWPPRVASTLPVTG